MLRVRTDMDIPEDFSSYGCLIIISGALCWLLLIPKPVVALVYNHELFESTNKLL